MKSIKVGIVASKRMTSTLYIPVDDLKEKGITICIFNSTQNIFKFIYNVDILHFIFPFDFFRYILFSKLLGKKIILQWVGTDVLLATKRTKHKILTKVLKLICHRHLTEANNLRTELEALDIYAEQLSLISCILNYSVTPFPENFTVLSYLPDKSHEFYGSSIICTLAEEFPSVRFLVVGGTKKKQKDLPNIRYFGWCNDMDTIYRKSTVLVRMTRHDGNSRMVLEALSYGRQVIRSVEFPYCYNATNYEETKKYLLEIMENPRLNTSGAQYIVNKYSVENISSSLEKLYKSMIS